MQVFGNFADCRKNFLQKILDVGVQEEYTALSGARKKNCNHIMKATKKKIGELVDIQTGYVFRGKSETSGKGNVRVIQNRDINDGAIHFAKLEKVNFPDRGKQERVRKGDIIFRSRGASFCFVQVTEDPGQDEVIVASPLQLIRVKDTKEVDPAYLAWAFQQDGCQVQLEAKALGTMIRTVSKSALEDVEIALPTVERQRKIVEIATLAAEIKRLSMELAEKQEAYVKAILNK